MFVTYGRDYAREFGVGCADKCLREPILVYQFAGASPRSYPPRPAKVNGRTATSRSTIDVSSFSRLCGPHPMQRSSAVALNEDSHAYRAPTPSSATIRMEMSVEINPLLLVLPLVTTPPKIDDLIDY